MLVFGLVVSQARAAEVVLVLGDSLSAGYGIDINAGWVSLLGERLEAMNPAHLVVNASISGDTTEGGRVRIRAALARYRPTVVVVALGGNDGLRGVAVSRVKKNLGEILRACKAAGSRALLLGVRLPPNYGPVFNGRFAAAFETLAARYAVPLVPRLLDGIGENPQLMQSDGIHPTARAQARMLDNVWPALETVIHSD